MKKVLYGTTALVAAGVLASASASAQDKAGPVELKVGGYMTAHMAYTDQDTGATQAVGDRRNFGFFREGEIIFKGQTRLDNGLLVGVNVQLEAEDSTDQIDEAYIFFDSPFGRVEFGSTDQAASKMYYGSPSFIPGFNPAIQNYVDWNSNAATANVSSMNLMLYNFNDAEHITYYTPRFFGFQIGVSYTPENCQAGNNEAGGGLTTPAGCGGSYAGQIANKVSGQQSDLFDIAANYVNSFNGFDVAVYGGWQGSTLDVENNNGLTPGSIVTGGNEAIRAWGAGAQLGYAGFSVGGAYKKQNTGRFASTGGKNMDQTSWTVGVGYKTGPWGIGIDYSQIKQEQGVLIGAAGTIASATDVAGEDEGTFLQIGGTYLVGPGITAFVGATHATMDDGSNGVVAGTTNSVDNTATVFRVGTNINF